jgi:ferritin-like metal-binding protein YciE
MKEAPEAISSLQNLLEYDTRKFISSEVQLANTLPHWIAVTLSAKMKGFLLRYLELIKDNIRKMENFTREENIRPVDYTNGVMHSMIEDTDVRLSHCNTATLKDACLLSGIQAINHCKISRYGTAASFAHSLGADTAASVFHEATMIEKEVDSQLSKLAREEINSLARSAILMPDGSPASGAAGSDIPKRVDRGSFRLQ